MRGKRGARESYGQINRKTPVTTDTAGNPSRRIPLNVPQGQAHPWQRHAFPPETHRNHPPHDDSRFGGRIDPETRHGDCTAFVWFGGLGSVRVTKGTHPNRDSFQMGADPATRRAGCYRDTRRQERWLSAVVEKKKKAPIRLPPGYYPPLRMGARPGERKRNRRASSLGERLKESTRQDRGTSAKTP